MDGKEIIVKGVRVEDTQYGPRIGIVDMEGKWYNSRKSKWSKLPGTWEGLTSLKEGERVHIDYEVKSYTAKDGTAKTMNEIVGYDIVIRPQDEVKPVEGPCLPGETTPSAPRSAVPETGARQTCYNVGERAVSQWLSKSELWEGSSEEYTDLIIKASKQLYNALKEPW